MSRKSIGAADGTANPYQKAVAEIKAARGSMKFISIMGGDGRPVERVGDVPLDAPHTIYVARVGQFKGASLAEAVALACGRSAANRPTAILPPYIVPAGPSAAAAAGPAFPVNPPQ